MVPTSSAVRHASTTRTRKGYFGGALKQSQADLSSELNTANGQTSLTGAQIRGIEDIGFEAGGAIVKDRLWLWGSWGQQDIKQNAASGVPDDTILENTSLKANGQINAANSIVGSWNNGDKLKFGRGASVTRPRPTTWNQRGPSAVYRLEDTHVFGSNFFLTGTFSHGDFGFQLLAIGSSGDGLAAGEPDPRQDSAGVWQDNYLSGGSSRPYDEFKADTSYFFTSGNLNHEVKVGGRLRQFQQNSDFSWGPRDTYTRRERQPGDLPPWSDRCSQRRVLLAVGSGHDVVRQGDRQLRPALRQAGR